MKTIKEAVSDALDEWAEAGTDDGELHGLAEEYALAAIKRWKDETEAGKKLLSRDDDTICGAVLGAMDDWASSDHSLGDMKDLITEHVERATDEWMLAKRTPVVPAARM